MNPSLASSTSTEACAEVARAAHLAQSYSFAKNWDKLPLKFSVLHDTRGSNASWCRSWYVYALAHAEGFATYYPRDRKARGQSRQSCLAAVPEIQRALSGRSHATQVGASPAASEERAHLAAARLAASH